MGICFLDYFALEYLVEEAGFLLCSFGFCYKFQIFIKVQVEMCDRLYLKKSFKYLMQNVLFILNLVFALQSIKMVKIFHEMTLFFNSCT